MESRFLKFGAEQKLFEKDNKILLAVSGGKDSIVMFHLFLKTGHKISVAHCNFGLRGKESDADAEFIKQLCKNKGVKFYSKKFKTKEYSKKNKISIQVAARELRYKWFYEILDKDGFESLATAHHLDDSIETFFINLLRGTGLKGLTGIPIKSNRIIRPLSGFSRKEIDKYATKEKLKWREDSSNRSDDYLRNRIRHKLSPLLAQLQPDFSAIMLKNIEHLHQSAKSLDNYTDIINKKYLEVNSENNWTIKTGELVKDEDAVLKLHLILSNLGIKSKDIESMLVIGQAGKQYYSGEFRLLRDRNTLLIEKRSVTGFSSILLSGEPQEIELNGTVLQFETSALGKNQNISKDPNFQQIDAEKLRFPLELRQWKDGDFFIPLGMKKRKKISDFLIDQKINRFEKEKCMILLSGRDIVCILGLRIDDRFKITDKTYRIFSITINKNRRD